MFHSSILEVAIGLFFIFLLYSLLATALREMIAGILDQRARTLYKGIASMLTKTERYNGLLLLWISYLGRIYRNAILGIKSIWKNKEEDTLYNRFYKHPIIKNYGQNYLFKKPSYISPQNFSSILLEIIKEIDEDNKDKRLTLDMIKNVLESEKRKVCIDDELKQILIYHLNESGGDIDVFKARLEIWFNDTMDRVSGWYKRTNQFWLMGIGLILCFIFNLDTIETSEYLSTSHDNRKELVEMAGIFIEKYPADSLTQQKLGGDVLNVIHANIKPANTIVGLGWGDFGRTDSTYIKNLAKVEEPSRFHKCMAVVPLIGYWSQTKVSVYESLQYFLTDSVLVKTNIDNLLKIKKDSLAHLYNVEYAKLKNKLFKPGLDTIKNDKILFAFRDSFISKNDSLMNQYKSDAKNWKLADNNKLKLRQQVLLESFNADVFQSAATPFRLWYIKSQMGWRKLFSFFITAIAIGLGAPFWFDLLSKLMKLRSTGKVITTNGEPKKIVNKSIEIEG